MRRRRITGAASSASPATVLRCWSPSFSSRRASSRRSRLGQRPERVLDVLAGGRVHLALLRAAGVGELDADEPGVRGVGTTPHQPGLLHRADHPGHRRGRDVQRARQVALGHVRRGGEEAQAHRLAVVDAVARERAHQRAVVQAQRPVKGAERPRRQVVDALERLGRDVGCAGHALLGVVRAEKGSRLKVSRQTTFRRRCRFQRAAPGEPIRGEGSCRFPRNPRVQTETMAAAVTTDRAEARRRRRRAARRLALRYALIYARRRRRLDRPLRPDPGVAGPAATTSSWCWRRSRASASSSSRRRCSWCFGLRYFRGSRPRRSATRACSRTRWRDSPCSRSCATATASSPTSSWWT